MRNINSEFRRELMKAMEANEARDAERSAEAEEKRASKKVPFSAIFKRWYYGP